MLKIVYQICRGMDVHKIFLLARMLLTDIYNILKKNEPYNPELYRNSDKPPMHREISIQEAFFVRQQ